MTTGGGGGATGGRGGRGAGGGGAPPGDGGACPANPNPGGRCNTVGEACPYAGGTITCTCEMGANADRWTCTGGGRDGGFMFDGGRMRDAAGGG
jgi:hypothetical protein